MSHLDMEFITPMTSLQLRLNPCCNGCRTWTERSGGGYHPIYSVLILVVMDVALGRELHY